MRLVFSTLCLAMASVASADTLPILNWSGVANVAGGFSFDPPNAAVTPDGLSVTDAWNGVAGSLNYTNIQDNYDATTAFTVTSAGAVQLSGFGGFGVYSSTCSDSPGCVPIGANLLPLELDFTATVSILNSKGNTVATESFSGSSAPAPYGNCMYFPGFNQEACTATAEVGGSTPSGLFDLSTGDYTLDVNVSSVAYDVYGNVVTGYSQLEGDLTPIPTPEPREWWMLLALSGVFCVAKMRFGRKRQVLR
jgi:hypothetical protein